MCIYIFIHQSGLIKKKTERGNKAILQSYLYSAWDDIIGSVQGECLWLLQSEPWTKCYANYTYNKKT